MILKGGSIRAFFENPILLSCISSWFLAQLIKAIIFQLRKKNKGRRALLITVAWTTGGMPSSHAALVSAMATSVAFKEGINSSLFIVTIFVALIFMRDAMGVRRSSGLQAASLNILFRYLSDKLGYEYPPVKEVHGHAPLEVLVGALLGVIIAAAYASL